MDTREKPQEKKRQVWLPHWERYLENIPKRGLNNRTKEPVGYSEIRSKLGLPKEWEGNPTLPRRLRKIVAFGLFTQAPPFFHYAGSMAASGTEKENLPKVKELTKEIIKSLEELYDKMDTVTVLPEAEVEHWKERIKETIYYIREQSKWIGMTLIQEAEYKVLEGK